jgi:hypothetical protein
VAAPTSTPPVLGSTGGEIRFVAYTTGYGFPDNTPAGSAISNPVIHQSASGTGTYQDPITVGVGHSITRGKDTLDYILKGQSSTYPRSASISSSKIRAATVRFRKTGRATRATKERSGSTFGSAVRPLPRRRHFPAKIKSPTSTWSSKTPQAPTL